jgi:hypothetical protein
MKKFMFKDKTGRGITTRNISLESLLQWDNEEDWNDKPLHEWAKDCDEGDDWENRTMKIICTKS